MRYLWLAAFVLALPAAACSPSETPPSPPANVQALPGAGAYDQRLDDVTQELRDALEARYGRLEVNAYKLPPPTAWPSLSTYYESALSAWSAEPALSESIRAAKARAWARRGTVFAVALIDKPIPGHEVDYKLLVTATNP